MKRQSISFCGWLRFSVLSGIRAITMTAAGFTCAPLSSGTSPSQRGAPVARALLRLSPLRLLPLHGRFQRVGQLFRRRRGLAVDLLGREPADQRLDESIKAAI